MLPGYLSAHPALNPLLPLRQSVSLAAVTLAVFAIPARRTQASVVNGTAKSCGYSPGDELVMYEAVREAAATK